MTKTNIAITRYEDGDFWIDIVDQGDTWEAWLTHKQSGVSDLMFGWPKTQTDGITYDFDAFCELVEGNLSEYEDSYREEHDESCGDFDDVVEEITRVWEHCRLDESMACVAMDSELELIDKAETDREKRRHQNRYESAVSDHSFALGRMDGIEIALNCMGFEIMKDDEDRIVDIRRKDEEE